MEIVNVKVKDLKPYEKNAKNHSPEQVDRLVKSIELTKGLKQPIVIDKNNYIVVGHGRVLACKKLGIEQVPCVYCDGMTDDEIKAYRLADNKTNESDWDLGFMQFEIGNLGIDMSVFGFITEEEDKKEKKEKMYEKMELNVFEHYDYLVFVFKNQQDFLSASDLFEVKKLDAGFGSNKKIGLGRVIDGEKLIEKIRR